MGVQGLTTYIAKKAECYLKPFELHDCLLVIDGDSLASNLYQYSPDCNSAFGGDYDVYYRLVIEFFAKLRRCNIRSFVLLDGGYQKRKLRTVQERLRGKIGAIKRINPIDGHHIFPLMMREVFVEAVRVCPGVQLMRCLFEADDEVAMLARQLNCPVLSYDSDFYIHNVQYIPYITLTMKVLKRSAPRRNRRKPAATSKAVQSAFKAYNYLDCCVYTIANLAGNKIRDEVLPLFGTLLGNDYINRYIFKKFFDNLSRKNIGKRNSPQQKRIISLLRWLENETLESALVKVLDRVEKEKRPWLTKEIEQAMAGYIRADSEAFVYFGLTDDDIMTRDVTENICETESESEEEISEEDDDVGEDQIESGRTSHSDDEDETFEPIDRTYTDPDGSKNFVAPAWLLPRLLAGELPRYVVDLLSLRMYINSPQVENFMLPESNAVALPILQLIFSLIHHPEQATQFQYLTRLQRISNFQYQPVAAIDCTTLQFDPNNPVANLDIFRHLFADHPNAIETALTLSGDHQLFFLSIIYAAKHSKQLSVAFIHSLAIGLCVLNEATRLCPPMTRQSQEFNKRFAKRFAEIATGTPQTKEKHQLVANQALCLHRNVLPHFQLNPKLRSKHTDFSSTTVHGFAEMQAVMFQLNTLNSVLGHPFQSMSIAHLCNGSFWYNMTMALQSRPDISHYVRVYVFQDCEHFFNVYTDFIEAVRPFVACLAGPPQVTRKMSRNRRKREKKMSAAKAQAHNDVSIEPTIESNENDDSDDFNDVNNQFSGLSLGK